MKAAMKLMQSVGSCIFRYLPAAITDNSKENLFLISQSKAYNKPSLGCLNKLMLPLIYLLSVNRFDIEGYK